MVSRTPIAAPPDIWSEWLLRVRHGGNAAYQAIVKDMVARYADRVLDDARLFPGMTLLDVGTGDGLVAFRAIERMGPSISVVFSDISAALLEHDRTLAAERGIEAQCTFIECSADRLAPISDESIDTVVTRASIAYVADKRAVFAEMLRVLKPGGRISIAEPVLQDEAFLARALRRRVDSQAASQADSFLPLLHRWKAAQYPDTEDAYAACPHVNYSERDLLHLVRGAGFTDVRLQLHIDVSPSLITAWDIYLASSPHPKAPSLGEVMAERFSAEERQLFEKIVRPAVESGKTVTIDRVVYLNAVKPAEAAAAPDAILNSLAQST